MMSHLTIYGDLLSVDYQINQQILAYFPLVEGKNFKIDSIDNFLSKYKIFEIPRFQYIRHALELSIKINFSQDYISDNGILESGVSFHSNKYMKYILIENENDNRGCYYFIQKSRQISQNCVEFTLKMDTLNTCFDSNNPRDLIFSEKTTITRRHESRFILNGSNVGDDYIRRIPILGEGLNPTKYKYSKESEYLNQDINGETGLTWYLIYTSKYNEGKNYDYNPLSLEIVANKPVQVGEYTPSNFKFTYDLIKSYLILYSTLELTYSSNSIWIIYENDNFEYSLNGTTNKLNIGESLVIYFYNGKYRIALNRDGTTNPTELAVVDKDTILELLDGWTTYYVVDVPFYPSLSKEINSEDIILKANTDGTRYNIYTGDGNLLVPFSEIDRTDNKLVKIIALPYAPFDFIQFNGYIQISNKYNFKYKIFNRKIVIEDIETTTLSTELTNDNKTFVTFKDMAISLTNRQKTDKRKTRKILDSAFYHSEFYTKRLVYDSFKFNYCFERYFNDETIPSNFDWSINSFNNWSYVSFVVSNGLNSSFLFDFSIYRAYDLNLYPFESMDYDEMIYVNRNNQIATFTSNYLNYMRVGYNYDIKNKNVQAVNRVIGVGASIATGITSFTTGDPTKIVKGATGIVTSLSSAITSQILTENAIAEKLDTYKNESVSVANADDFNLLQYYSKNKLKMEIWKPSPQMMSLLDDLFYYTGYKVNVMEKPTHNNRLWFDFLACNPIWESTTNYDDDIVEDLNSKLQEGVTFFHNVNGEYDIKQENENWERALIN